MLARDRGSCTKSSRVDPGIKKGPAARPGLLKQARALPAVASAATATVAAAEPATTAGTPAATAARLVLRLIHAQLTTAHIVAVQALDRTSRISLAHLDEAKAPRPSGLTIGRQRYGLDSPVL